MEWRAKAYVPINEMHPTAMPMDAFLRTANGRPYIQKFVGRSILDAPHKKHLQELSCRCFVLVIPKTTPGSAGGKIIASSEE